MPRGEPIPTLSGLRDIVRNDPSKTGHKIPWISQFVILPYVAIYFTKLFLHLRWCGDHVTLLMTACAFLGPICFFIGGTRGYVIGACLMLLSWALDHADGQVRRYRGEDSIFSIYLDRFTHRVSYLYSTGWGVRRIGAPAILRGAVACLSAGWWCKRSSKIPAKCHVDLTADPKAPAHRLDAGFGMAA